MRIDWDVVSTQPSEGYDIGSYCGHVLEALQLMCDDPVARRVISSRVDAFICRIGDAQSLELDGRVLTWTASFQTYNEVYAARNLLLSIPGENGFTLGETVYTSAMNSALSDGVASTNQACGTSLSLSVDWDSVPAQPDGRYDAEAHCGNVLAAMRDMCREPTSRRAFAEHVDRVVCRQGEAVGAVLEGRNLVWTSNREVPDAETKTREWLGELPIADGMTLGEATALAKSQMCKNSDGTYVGLAVERSGDTFIVYGSDGAFYKLPEERLGAGSFYEPREFNPRGSKRFRGFDTRYYSKIDVDRESGTCALRCGTRRIDLHTVTTDETKRLLMSADWKPLPDRRKPYALARDRKGRYFYVDLADKKGARDFRVFSGLLGALKPLKMKNVVSDSSGDVFSTKSGTLRLVFEKPHSIWIVGKREKKLVNVDIADNLSMIFNELGVYSGQRYGTPCEHF